MNFWSKLAQVFLGIFIGYWIVQVVILIATLSMIGLVGVGLSGGGVPIFSILMSCGLLLIGLIVALAVGIIGNMLLIAFLPISGVVSSFTSIIFVIYYIFQLILSF